MITNNGNVNAVFVSGNTGEGIVQSIIEQSNLTFYHNIYLKDSKGKITQIDFLVITDRALICVEVKNYSKCVVKGDDTAQFWTACYRSGNRNFLNPIRQNNAHVNVIKDCLGKDLTVYNVVVFANSCNIRTTPTEVKFASVVNTSDLWYELIDIKTDTRVKKLSDDVKNNIVAKLDEFVSNSAELYREHQEQHFNKKKV